MFVAVTFLATATEMVQGDRRNLLYSVPAPGTSQDQPTPHHKSSRHGHVTAENWNQ